MAPRHSIDLWMSGTHDRTYAEQDGESSDSYDLTPTTRSGYTVNGIARRSTPAHRAA